MSTRRAFSKTDNAAAPEYPGVLSLFTAAMLGLIADAVARHDHAAAWRDGPLTNHTAVAVVAVAVSVVGTNAHAQRAYSHADAAFIRTRPEFCRCWHGRDRQRSYGHCTNEEFLHSVLLSLPLRTNALAARMFRKNIARKFRFRAGSDATWSESRLLRRQAGQPHDLLPHLGFFRGERLDLGRRAGKYPPACGKKTLLHGLVSGNRLVSR